MRLFLLVLIASVQLVVCNAENKDICTLSVAELIEQFQSHKLSPVDLLQAQMAKIEAENSKINAVSEKHYEEALVQARESERRYREGTNRPLEGITIAVKDDSPVKGWKSTMGSKILKDVKPAEKDCALIKMLRESGAVFHIQTNVPEYYCNLVTWNFLYGTTRNPWNLKYTPGGSSGGAAAALAAGFTTLAMGSDMGGSIRFPAAMTGLYGFKPPYGRVPTSLVQYESAGPMARTFEDMNYFQNAMAGPSSTMISAIRPKLSYPTSYGDIKGWKIAYDPMDKWGIPVDNTVKKAMKEAVRVLQSMGAEVVEVDLGFRASDFETYALGIFSTSIGPFCFEGPKEKPELVTPYVTNLVKKYAAKISPQHLVTAEEWSYEHSDQIQKKLFSKGFRAIIMPTMCTPFVVADLGKTAENNVVMINGEAYPATTWSYSFTWPWNMLGQYPVVNVPIGRTPENIPLGMQIIANTYDDISAFQVAANWSKNRPRG